MIDTTERNNFILYTTDSGHTNVQIVVDREHETIWLSQKQIAAIFDVEVNTINYHIKEIFSTGELDENSVIRIFRITANDGKSYQTNHYNLDMIIAVGYRVNSYKATQFRIWATKTLREFIIKGFVLDDERLKQGNQVFNKDYFAELVERIRDIRASEKLFYEKIRSILALSVDYKTTAPEARLFYAHFQNKLEYASTGMTSAEIIKARADHNLTHIGLTTFKDKKIKKSDVTIAKNYLTEKEIKDLNLLVNMLLDYLENQASKNKIFYMRDWLEMLDKFLEFNEYQILQSYGKVKKSLADAFAVKEYDKYKIIEDNSDVEEFYQAVDIIKSTGKLPKKNSIKSN